MEDVLLFFENFTGCIREEKLELAQPQKTGPGVISRYWNSRKESWTQFKCSQLEPPRNGLMLLGT